MTENLEGENPARQMNVDNKIGEVFRLFPEQKRALVRLGLETIYDLLLHFPTRYAAGGDQMAINELKSGDTATIFGRLRRPKISRAWRKKIPMAEAVIEDATGKIKAVWFHQAYIVKKFPEGSLVKVSGRVAERKGSLYFANPEIGDNAGGLKSKLGGLFSGKDAESNTLVPVYPESKGVSSNWIRHAVERVFKSGLWQSLADPLPEDLRRRYHLPALATALMWIHWPRREADALAARKRFSFENILILQTRKLLDRQSYQQKGGHPIKINRKEMEMLASSLPFSLTSAQERTLEEIFHDLESSQPMMRLLEGDVGSGKTAVAAIAAFAAARNGGQVAFMAPTEVLARQHFGSFIEIFRHLNLPLGLISGAECRKFPSKISPNKATHISRPQFLKWLARGELPIVIGTHALIQDRTIFKNLTFTIIDEQHRFGLMQRARLLAKNQTGVPHLLSMTATPIPRTLALTAYGDLDLSILDKMPPGRRAPETKIVNPDSRQAIYETVRRELKNGRQVYVICPRIDEPDPTKALALNAKSAKTEQRRLQEKVFTEWRVGLIHGKLKPKDKERVMAEFTAGQIQILVATSVVEVGVNVPNATIIIIEGAERFGLAQMHQFRGRVQRSTHQSYCYLFTDSASGAAPRLKAMAKSASGFALAELDLKIRGAGSLTGSAQWGLTDVGMEALKNLKLVQAARTEAAALVNNPNLFSSHPALAERITGARKIVHFE